MKKRGPTQGALLASVISLLLCLSMLVGTTFAWFTDTDTAAVSAIRSGDLDIQLQDENGRELSGSVLYFVDANGSSDLLFEPGATFHTPKFKLHQNGNLEFKYKIEITGFEGDTKLLEAVSFSLMNEDGQEIDLARFEGRSKDFEGLDSGLMYIRARMDGNAGNAYQGMTLKGIAITVYATQDTVEYDSLTDQYDADAEYLTEPQKEPEVHDDAQLTEAIEAKKEYAVGEGTYSKVVVADGVTVTVNGGNFENQIVAARNGATVTVKNASGRTGSSGQNVIANVSSGSTLLIEGGNYPLFNTLLYGDGTGTVVISGGYFDGACFWWNMGASPVAKLTVTGGTFGPNFMYTHSMMGPSLADFVPETHRIVQNADGSCTVMAK